MDMRAKKGSADGASTRAEIGKILRGDPAKLEQWCAVAGIDSMGSVERTIY
jgi:hypothetical protein